MLDNKVHFSYVLFVPNSLKLYKSELEVLLVQIQDYSERIVINQQHMFHQLIF